MRFLARLMILVTALCTAAVANQTTPLSKAPHELTASDLDNWLAGFMDAAMSAEQIAGAVVVVVKDGEVLYKRGYGYADAAAKKPIDPDTTLFRNASISKLFVWTAIMQLVERGQVDLDTNINAYLDFRVDGKSGKPITLRHLMTHRAGFQELGKNSINDNPALQVPLETFVKRYTPTRIFEPGAMPAYSNYGASLAGYIVQRVSRMPYETYMERNIFAPLGMRHSSFRQPLSPGLLRLTSKGYDVATNAPKPFELMNDTPAGSLSAPAGDIAKFMIAHLDGGGDILKPESARLMQLSEVRAFPQLPGMALGFYRSDTKGRRIITHAGDLNWFHSELNLFIDDNVGIYISTNSAGVGQLDIRETLFQAFVDRYFSDKRATAGGSTKVSKQHAAEVAGHYVITRRFDRSLAKIANLFSQASLEDLGNGKLLLNLGGVTKTYREIGPYLWQEEDGPSQISVKMASGKPTLMGYSKYAPIIAFQPIPIWQTPSFVVMVLFAAILVLVVSVAVWPVAATIRRYFGISLILEKRESFFFYVRQLMLWIVLAAVVAWGVLIVPNVQTGLSEQNNTQILATQWLTNAVFYVGIVAIVITIIGLFKINAAICKKLLILISLMSVTAIFWLFHLFDLTEIGVKF